MEPVAQQVVEFVVQQPLQHLAAVVLLARHEVCLPVHCCWVVSFFFHEQKPLLELLLGVLADDTMA